ncbi:hypothetical protein CGRA01v4_01026 [Colletotrichum graminicola]|nr:hypothetical protein CGRA01v4_01026 [Colletotrichum graminicola]
MITKPRMRTTVPHPQNPGSLADARSLHSTRTVTGNHYLMLQLVRTEMPRTGRCLIHPRFKHFRNKNHPKNNDPCMLRWYHSLWVGHLHQTSYPILMVVK